ncbi:MAG: hypothetical protein WD334_00670 [Chitinophagales bacterium]
MLPFKRIYPFFIFFIANAYLLKGQEVSPYSQYGLGDVQSKNFAAAKGFGGASSAFRNSLFINPVNPASYSSLVLTTMEFGVNANYKSMQIGDSTYTTGDGFIDYIALGFPISKSVGTSVGLIPFSKTNYSYQQTIDDPDLGEVSKLYRGKGRLYRLYAGAAYQFPKTDTAKHLFSVGANMVYIFGQNEFAQGVSFPSNQNAFNSRQTSEIRFGDFAWDFGLQYKLKLEDDHHLVFGASAELPFNVKTTRINTYEKFRPVSPSLTIIDTIGESSAVKEKLGFPFIYRAGFSYSKADRLTTFLDFEYSTWSRFQPSYQRDIDYEDSWRISGGLEYVPKPSKKFFNQLIYRLGAYYDKGFFSINGQQISEFGTSFGLSFPLKSAFSKINVSLEGGSRGTNAEGLIKENFFRTYISLTLNDKWFVKRKYE